MNCLSYVLHSTHILARYMWKCENLSPIFMFIKCILKGYPRQNDVMWSKFFSLIFGPVASFQKIINNLYSLDSILKFRTGKNLEYELEDITWLRRDKKFVFQCLKIFHEWANMLSLPCEGITFRVKSYNYLVFHWCFVSEVSLRDFILYSIQIYVSSFSFAPDFNLSAKVKAWILKEWKLIKSNHIFTHDRIITYLYLQFYCHNVILYCF